MQTAKYSSYEKKKLSYNYDFSLLMKRSFINYLLVTFRIEINLTEFM